ncbi:MAG: alpha/beta hydrolase [Anaerolineae bacterium]|nr:alpha/beta hydrolase [Anaerolineae bacterium]
MKLWRRILLTLIAVVLVAAVGALLWITRSQAHGLVTHPMDERPPLAKTPADYGLPYEEVSVTTADGLKLVGWYIPSQNGALVMAQHGYKVNRTDLLPEAEMLYKSGYGVLLMSIRAHDLSDGEYITLGYKEMQDLDAWYQYVLTRDDVDPECIGIIGNSMGGALAIQYASQNKNIKAVVAHSAFATFDDTIATTLKFYTGLPPFPFVPMILFWANQETHQDFTKARAVDWIGDISPRPVFLLQGGADQQISPNSGQMLYDAAGEPKELWFDPELGHTEFTEKRTEEFETRLIAFYDKYLLGK